MSYKELITKRLLKKEDISFNQINKVLKKSYQNLKSAKILLKNKCEDEAFELAYEAMMVAGRALAFSYGLRPRAAGSHKIVIDFTEKVLGKDYQVLVKKFDKMRKKRHNLIYEVDISISLTEAKQAIKSAEEFLDKIKEIIQKNNPQKKLL